MLLDGAGMEAGVMLGDQLLEINDAAVRVTPDHGAMCNSAWKPKEGQKVRPILVPPSQLALLIFPNLNPNPSSNPNSSTNPNPNRTIL